MTEAEQLELIRRHAPLMWLHEDEAFHPVSADRMVDHSVLMRRASGRAASVFPQPASAAELADVPDHGHCHLHMRDLNYEALSCPDGRGPDALARFARRTYGRDLHASGVPSSGPDSPRYYARVKEASSVRPHATDPPWEYVWGHPVWGTYVRIEYFFLFVYNDAWNQHQADWDAAVVLYLERDDAGRPTDRGYMVTHAHHERWTTRLAPSTEDLLPWIGSWQASRRSSIGRAYATDGHPWVFVARGAHGAYPTPGITVFGFKPDLPFLDNIRLLTNTDVRQMGKVCIAPPGTDPDAVRTRLSAAGLDATGTRFGTWAGPDLADAQPWIGYQGSWGAPSPFMGWSGPDAKLVRGGTQMRDLKYGVQHHYAMGTIQANWHHF